MFRKGAEMTQIEHGRIVEVGLLRRQLRWLPRAAMRAFSLGLVALMLASGCKRNETSAASDASVAPVASCEAMCDHANDCVAARLGVAPKGEIFRDARSNCIFGCQGPEVPKERIACWTQVACEKIDSEQGLARRACPGEQIPKSKGHPPEVLGKTAAALDARPELLMNFPWEWQKRIDASLNGANSCPIGSTPQPANEFEGKLAKGDPCAEDSKRALGFLKACPRSAQVQVEVSMYDFERKRFVLRRKGQIAGAGLSSLCGIGLKDEGAAAANLTVELPLAEPDAKLLREKLELAKKEERSVEPAIHLAFVQDDGAVGSMCEGERTRILGWRLSVETTPRTWLTRWIGASPWDPPASCSDAKDFFGIKEPKSSYLSMMGDATCVCRYSKKFATASAWFPVQWNYGMDTCQAPAGNGTPGWTVSQAREFRKQLADTGAVFDSVAARVESAPGCALDGSAQVKMKAIIDDVRKVRSSWTRALEPETPNQGQIASANSAACKLKERLAASCSDGCKFGCP